MEEKKFCKFCGEEIFKDNIVCPKCGRQLSIVKKQENKEPVRTENENKNKKEKKFYEQLWFMWIMLIFFAPVGIFLMWKFNTSLKKHTKIILSIVFSLLFIIILFGTSDDETNDNTNENTTNNEKNDKYTLGDTITFDDLQLTFDKEYSFTTVDNMFSNHNEKPVIKIGVTIKNISSKNHNLNMFYYDMFGSSASELDSVSSYFEETVDFAGELKPGASYKKYFYLLYDGNGTYSIDFDNFFEKISLEFEIIK